MATLSDNDRRNIVEEISANVLTELKDFLKPPETIGSAERQPRSTSVNVESEMATEDETIENRTENDSGLLEKETEQPKIQEVIEVRVNEQEKEKERENELGERIERLAQAMMFGNKQVQTRFDYKLTRDYDLEVWFSLLETEASLKGIDTNKETFTAEENQVLRTLIIARVDEYHLKRLIAFKNAKEMLKEITDFRRAEANLSSNAIKLKFDNTVLRDNEPLNQYFDRIERICQEARMIGRKIDEFDIYDQIINGTKRRFPSVRLRAQLSGGFPHVSIDDLKKFLLTEASEAECKEKKGSPAKALIADSKSNGNMITCYNCGLHGHMSRECPSPEGHKTCYICRRSGHIAIDCFYNKNLPEREHVPQRKYAPKPVGKGRYDRREKRMYDKREKRNDRKFYQQKKGQKFERKKVMTKKERQPRKDRNANDKK